MQLENFLQQENHLKSWKLFCKGKFVKLENILTINYKYTTVEMMKGKERKGPRKVVVFIRHGRFPTKDPGFWFQYAQDLEHNIKKYTEKIEKKNNKKNELQYFYTKKN